MPPPPRSKDLAGKNKDFKAPTPRAGLRSAVKGGKTPSGPPPPPTHPSTSRRKNANPLKVPSIIRRIKHHGFHPKNAVRETADIEEGFYRERRTVLDENQRVPAVPPPKSGRKWKSGAKSLREIRLLQRFTGTLTPITPFTRYTVQFNSTNLFK